MFTPTEMARLGAGVIPGSFWARAVPIGRWTGLRLSDIASLEWASLSTTIAVWTIKKDKRVELPLYPEELEQAVSGIPKVDEKYCFPEQRRIVWDPKRRHALSMQFKRLCHRCGIFGKSFHFLRHTYVTACWAAGEAPEHIAKHVGHSSTSQTRAYNHLFRRTAA